MIKGATLTINVLPIMVTDAPPSEVLMMTVQFLDADNQPVGPRYMVGFKPDLGNHHFKFAFPTPLPITGVTWEYYYEVNRGTPKLEGVNFALHHVGNIG